MGLCFMKSKNAVTAKEIAEAAGVSLSTVSMVLNKKGNEYRISEKTAEKILETAKTLGYQHHEIKKGHTKKNSNRSLIAILCPMNFVKGPIDEFYGYAEKYLREQKLQYDVVLFPYELGNLKKKAGWISSQYVSGAVMMALSEEDIEFIENSHFDIPLILYNRSARGYSSVLNDDYNIGNKAMSHFIKRGHSKFGLISPNYSSKALSLRTVGYLDRFNSQNFDSDDAFVLPMILGEDEDMGGYNAMQEMFESEKLPTAIFLPSDNMVSGVVRCITEKGFKIPENFEIISYGNRLIDRIIKPGITSFEPSYEEMSDSSIMLLHKAIQNGSIETENVKLIFEGRCVFRESSPEV